METSLFEPLADSFVRVHCERCGLKTQHWRSGYYSRLLHRPFYSLECSVCGGGYETIRERREWQEGTDRVERSAYL